MAAPSSRAGRRRLPARLAPVLFGLLLSGMMSFLVSGIATARVVPLNADFPHAWMSAWAFSWAVACPAAVILAPIVRRLVARMVED